MAVVVGRSRVGGPAARVDYNRGQQLNDNPEEPPVQTRSSSSTPVKEDVQEPQYISADYSTQPDLDSQLIKDKTLSGYEVVGEKPGIVECIQCDGTTPVANVRISDPIMWLHTKGKIRCYQVTLRSADGKIWALRCFEWVGQEDG